jgi:hypothetical protein
MLVILITAQNPDLPKCIFSDYFKLFKSKSRVTAVEATVVQPRNIAPSRNRAVYRLRGSFFGSFLDKQKRTYNSLKCLLSIGMIKMNSFFFPFFFLDEKETKNQGQTIYNPFVQ